MTTKAKYSAAFKSEKAKVMISIPVIIFQELEIHIVYCPVLDVTGYGNTEDEARTSFNHCLQEFFHYTLNKKTLYGELEKLGWKVKRGRHEATPPLMTDRLNDNENLSRILNDLPFCKEEMSIQLPAFA